MPPSPQRAERFSYDGYTMDPTSGEVHCTYSTGGYSFTERYVFGLEGNWDDPAVDAAIRILYLLAGVSYYKTTAARVIDLGPTPTTAKERAFLTQFFAAAAYQLSGAFYVPDYSRYLPRSVGVRAPFYWTYVGAFAGSLWAMLVGTAAASAFPHLAVTAALGRMPCTVPEPSRKMGKSSLPEARML